MTAEEIRDALVKQYEEVQEEKATSVLGKIEKGLEIDQIQEDIIELDDILERNFGLYYNPKTGKYENDCRGICT